MKQCFELTITYSTPKSCEPPGGTFVQRGELKARFDSLEQLKEAIQINLDSPDMSRLKEITFQIVAFKDETPWRMPACDIPHLCKIELGGESHDIDKLLLLDEVSLQKVLREVESAHLAMILGSISDSLSAAILAALPRRAGNNVCQEYLLVQKSSALEIEQAKGRIVNLMRMLDLQGELTRKVSINTES